MKRSSVIILGCIALLLPFMGIIVAWGFLDKIIIDNAEFWYGYMAYFGTVLLAVVALFQNVCAGEVNNRLIKQQLRQKIGYFELKKVHEQKRVLSLNHEIIQMNGYQEVKVENPTDCLGRSDISVSPVVKICLKNVGEDVILNLDILSAKINEKDVIIPCSIKVVYKEEEIWFEIENIQIDNVNNLKIELFFQLENIAGIRYRQNIVIDGQKFFDMVKNNEKPSAVYIVKGFESSIDFYE